MSEKRKERVQFDFDLEALQRLDEIKDKTKAATRAEVVRNALRVYEWIVNEIDPNDTIMVLNENDDTRSMFKAKLLLR